MMRPLRPPPRSLADFDHEILHFALYDYPGRALPLGWALTERGAWRDRGQADFFLALALVHHLVIGGNIPVRAVVEALASVAPAGVVEFVSKEDEMVRRLLTNREDVFADYTRENFEAELSRCFRITGREDINQGTRTLYRMEAA